MYLSLRNKPDTDLSLPPAVRGRTGRVVPGAVIMLGLTSLFTDISAEMLTAILPIYLTMQVGLSSVQYGIVDGLYHGVSAVARLAAGVLSDRFDNAKSVAAVGYALSALVKPLLLVARSVGSIGLLMSVDRVGKGIRTAPRDAMIAASSPPQHLALNFGVHRTLDNTGAMLGPLIAFGLIAWDPHGYDGVFVGSFAFALIGLATLVLFVPGRRPPAGVAVAPSICEAASPGSRFMMAKVRNVTPKSTGIAASSRLPRSRRLGEARIARVCEPRAGAPGVAPCTCEPPGATPGSAAIRSKPPGQRTPIG